MQDIHDIRPPVSVGFDPALIKLIFIIVGGVLLALALLYLIIRLIRKGKDKNTIVPSVVAVSPYKAAMKSLNSLAGKHMGNPRKIYFDLTLILRSYIQASFAIHAKEMTTQELTRALVKLNLATELKKEIAIFLGISDPFKYAGMEAEQQQAANDLNAVKSIIERIEQELSKMDKIQEEGK